MAYSSFFLFLMEYVEYVLPSEISKHLTHPSVTTVFHLNARSIKNKFDQRFSLFNEIQTSFDNIMFTETWYQQDADMLNLDGYEHYFLRRSNKRGGGVSIYLKHNIHAELLDSYSKITSDYEILTIRQEKIYFLFYITRQQQTLKTLFPFLSNS